MTVSIRKIALKSRKLARRCINTARYRSLPSLFLPRLRPGVSLLSEQSQCFNLSHNLDEVNNKITSRYPAYTNKIIDLANRFCDHMFDILGSGPVDLNSVEFKKQRSGMYCYLPWFYDIKSGYRWDENTFYLDIPLEQKGDMDIKVPWELSRFNHLLPLGQAYLFTSDETYAKEAYSQIDNWIDTNRVGWGANWTCAMEASIRVCNWLVAWYFFKSSPLFSSTFREKFFTSILEHFGFIRYNLETLFDFKTNHYFSNICALVFCALLFAPPYRSDSFVRASVVTFYKEIERQFLHDGFNYERSTSYHCFMTEMALFTALLMKQNSITIPLKVLERIEKAVEVVGALHKPDGKIVLLGDNDNGRFLNFTYPETGDYTHIFSKDPSPFTFIMDSNMRESEEKEKTSSKTKKSFIFNDAGISIAKSADSFFIVSTGATRQNVPSAHLHNDILSFVLCVDGEDMIVDSGTYTYADRFWRNFFRSVSAHNTITIDKIEQHTPHTKTVFNLTHITKGNPGKVSNDATVIEGSYSLNHDRNTYMIRRKYTYSPSSKKILTIHDHIESAQRTSHLCVVYVYLNLSPHMTPVAIVGGKEKDTIPEVTIAKKNDHTHHVYTIKGDSRLSVDMSESWYAPEYGLKNPTQRIVFCCEEKTPIDCQIEILQPEANDDR